MFWLLRIEVLSVAADVLSLFHNNPMVEVKIQEIFC